MSDPGANKPHVLAEDNLVAGLPPEAERDRPGQAVKTGDAWVRGHGSMEGPTGWGSRFGRPGFASGDGPARPPVPNPLGDLPAPGPDPADTPEAALAETSQPGEASDAWDRPYGDASWGGPEAVLTPSEEREDKPSTRRPAPPDR